MEEELQESDVIWAGHQLVADLHAVNNVKEDKYREMIIPSQQNRRVPRNKVKKKSLPVNIPENIAGRSWFNCTDFSDFDDEFESGDIVPPHVMVGWRIAGKIAFSVCTGNGRTLKGRDLSQVRNSILRMTGFIET
ncbi:hypothetical protein HHK36_023456 [Tetracentron sinense]|uniref:Senescence regulator n=1 Tax=Tetracentron sinense TaxID=13715 RepID=A0A834YQ79_TETSI|nr:hypothetical protein HHK36_023456 [Tetracentron sinense]